MTAAPHPHKNLYIICGVLFCAAIAASLYFLSFDLDHLRDEVMELLTLARNSPWSYPIICGLYLLASLVMFPIIVLNLATAIVFGPLLGIVYALSGTLIAGTFFFFVGRYGRNRGLRHLLAGPRISTLDNKLRHAGVIGVAALRLVPMAPFGIFNMAAGITSLRYIDYLAGTFLAFWPGGIARAAVGDSLVDMFMDPTPESFAWLAAGAALWLAIVIALHYMLKRYRTA